MKFILWWFAGRQLLIFLSFTPITYLMHVAVWNEEVSTNVILYNILANWALASSACVITLLLVERILFWISDIKSGNLTLQQRRVNTFRYVLVAGLFVPIAHNVYPQLGGVLHSQSMLLDYFNNWFIPALQCSLTSIAATAILLVLVGKEAFIFVADTGNEDKAGGVTRKPRGKFNGFNWRKKSSGRDNFADMGEEIQDLGN